MTKGMKGWLNGLLSAFFSGASGVLAMTFVDPKEFNIDNPGKVAATAAIFGIVGLVNFLAKSPLPPDDDNAGGSGISANTLRNIGGALIFALVLTSAGCAPKSIQTPEGKAAYTANEVLIRVGELQKAAIHANQDGALSDANAVAIVGYTVDSAEVLRAVPSGWYGPVSKGYHALRKRLSPEVFKIPQLRLIFLGLDAYFGTGDSQ